VRRQPIWLQVLEVLLLGDLIDYATHLPAARAAPLSVHATARRPLNGARRRRQFQPATW